MANLKLNNSDTTKDTSSEVTYTDFSGKFPNLHELESIPAGNYFKGIPNDQLSWARREMLYPYDEGMEIQIETGYKDSFSRQVFDKLEKM